MSNRGGSLASVAVVFLCACSGGGVPPDGGHGIDGRAPPADTGVASNDAGGPPPDAMRATWDLPTVGTMYCDALIAATCDASARCECVPACDPVGDRLACMMPFETALGEGATHFDGALLLDLLDARRLYLDHCARRPQALVAQLVYGSIVIGAALGEACPDRYACAGGDGICVSGVCVDRPAVGESCVGMGHGCEPGARCSGGTCVVPSTPPGACVDDVGCNAPAVCIDGSCRDLAGAGEACGATEQCDPGHNCVGGACVASTICDGSASCGYGTECAMVGVCEETRPTGHPCTDDTNCDPGLTCTTAIETCEEAPAAGAPCARGRCAIGAFCESGTCVAKRTIGATCDPALDESCVDGAFCSRGGVCEADLADGETCMRTVECSSASHCNGGTCVPRPGAGEPCFDACLGDLGCIGGVCADPLGAACTRPEECGDVHVCRTTSPCMCPAL